MTPLVPALAAFLLLAAGPVRAGDPDLPALRSLHAQGRHAEAESLATFVISRLEASANPDSADLAEALFHLGDVLAAHHRWDDDRPVKFLTRSFEIRYRILPPDHMDLGLSAMRLAEEEAGLDPEAAASHARIALRVFEAQPVPNDTLISNTYVDLGQIDLLRGRGRTARDALEKGVTLRVALFGPADRRVASAIESLGDAYFMLGDVRRAKEAQEEALRILDLAGNPDDVRRGAPISRLAEVNQALGDYASAIEYARESVRIAAAAGDTNEMIASGFNLAGILQQFGDDEGCARVAASIVPWCDRFRESYQWIRGSVLQMHGTATLATGDTARAMEILDESVKVLTDHPDPGAFWRLPMCHLGRADALLGMKRYGEARDAIDQAILLNDGSPDPHRAISVTARTTLLRILEATGDTAAIDSVRSDLAALRQRPGFESPELSTTITSWLAHADRVLGRHEEAWQLALAADRQNVALLKLNLATLPDSRALELSRRRSAVLNQVLDMAGPDEPSRWRAAWDRLVRNRGLVRTELARRRLPAELSSDTLLVRLHERWVRAQENLSRAQVRNPVPAERAPKDELDRLHAQVESAESARARALAERGRDTSGVETGLDEVLARLTHGTALVAFAEYETPESGLRVIAFAAWGGSANVQRIDLGPSADLDRVVAAWRAGLSQPQSDDSTASPEAERECRLLGEEVRRRAWEPVLSVLGGVSEVTIVPDGPLVDIAWPALPASGDRYLVETGPMIRVLDAERDLFEVPESRSHTLLAVGNPDFGTVPAAETADLAPIRLRGGGDPCAGQIAGPFPPLPGTGLEVRQAAAAWQADATRQSIVLEQERATEAAFRETAPAATIVHLATHGVVIGDTCGAVSAGTRAVGGVGPLDTMATAVEPAPGRGPSSQGRAASPWMGRRVWLALASADHAHEGDVPGNDGMLTTEEVVTLNLSESDWVVLSACHSGLSTTWGREGPLGMRRAFLLAGARSVITSAWAVDDNATTALMRALFEHRAKGETRASAALREACREILSERRQAGRSTHPFFWAAFSATGT